MTNRSAPPEWSDAPVEPSQLVLQRGNHYTGPLVGGRYQVHGETERVWYIVDHRRADLLVRVAGPLSDVLRFKTKEEAENWCTTALGGNISPPVQQQEIDVAKRARVVTGETSPAAKKAAKAVKNGSGEAKTRTPRTDKPAAMFKELIMAGRFTDDVIFKKVQEKFGLDDKKRTYVAWYRNYLTKQGENPPAAK